MNAAKQMVNVRVAFFVVTALAIGGCQSIIVPVATSGTENLDSIGIPATQSDVPGMLAAVQKIDSARLSEKDAAIHRCIQARFAPNVVDPPERDLNLNPSAAAVLTAYKHYWRDVSIPRTTRADADQALIKKLVALLEKNGVSIKASDDPEKIGEHIKAVLERAGIHTLMGVTAPNFELMMWRSEEVKRYEVALPESKQAVDVAFISDFVISGWLSFLTCDKMSTGGWTTKERIYMVGSQVETEAVPLQLQTNLNHEGQHFADFVSYPVLEQAELEYRAKLTELALSTTDTKTALENFFRNGAVGRDNAPHSHAEYWLKQNLTKELPALTDASQRKLADDETIRKAARRLLLDSSTKLINLGAATVTRFLPN
jgi:hypothetical protein